MNRYSNLDMARGAAALFVLIDHSILDFIEPGPGTLLFKIATFMGSFGIALFFLISGFVIPFSLKFGSVNFIVRRIFRLYPVAIAATFFCSPRS